MLIQNRKILKTQVKELNIIFKKKITEQNDLFFISIYLSLILFGIRKTFFFY
jgi:hypothetical protein